MVPWSSAESVPLVRWLRWLPVGAALAAWAFHPSLLSGQIVEGRVLDADSQEPVAAASVELLAGDDEVQARTTTDDQGRFRLQARTSATYRIRAGRIGFRTVSTPPFDLIRDEEPFQVEVLLGVEAVPLAPLVVVSERPARVEHLRLHIRGFYERRNTWGREGMGFGQFLGPEELRRRILFDASDAVRDMRGVRIQGAGGRRRAITVRGGPFGRCPPPVYVDGVRLASGGGLDGIVSGSEVLAVEVYLGITGPPEFVGDCGAIVVWTGVP